MPIYEFRCKQCDTSFEKLFVSSQQKSSPSCPECENGDTTQLFSVFGVGTLNTVEAPATEMPMCGTCGHHTPKPCA
jgi:putative FmdB family regulatory protein